jgi:hypothetical protein
MRVRDRCEGGPALEAITDSRRVEGREPAADVREIACEHTRQPVRQAGFSTNPCPAMLDENLARSGGLIGWTPRLQLRLMVTDQCKSALGIRGIILLAAGPQCFTKRGQPPRSDGIKEVVTLLVNSKMRAKMVLYPTFEGQRNQGHPSNAMYSHGVGD